MLSSGVPSESSAYCVFDQRRMCHPSDFSPRIFARNALYSTNESSASANATACVGRVAAQILHLHFNFHLHFSR